jgi:hypothetical protein
VRLERDALGLVSTIEELLGRKSSGSGIERREYAVGIRHAHHVAPSIGKSAVARSVEFVRGLRPRSSFK